MTKSDPFSPSVSLSLLFYLKLDEELQLQVNNFDSVEFQKVANFSLKTRVFSRGKPQNLIQLQEWIKSAIEEVQQKEIVSAVGDLFYRCDLVKECNGNTFEHLL